MQVKETALLRLHLIDGTYELFRAHFGAPPRRDPRGEEIGAVHGLLVSTLSLLADEGVTHVGIVFDTVIESFRNDLFEGYKTGESTPPELLAQFPAAERAVAALGLTVWPMIEQEADDGLAAAAMKFAPEVDQVVIMSPDKDMTQLYGHPKIVGYDRRKGAFIDAAAVKDKFGVDPASIPDYLALVGDSADGIPGLPGWGAKSSATVLAEYQRLESIPESASDWSVKVRGASKLAETLKLGKDEAHLYRNLATLRTDMAIAQNLDDLEWRGARRADYTALCDELGFERLKERPGRWLP